MIDVITKIQKFSIFLVTSFLVISLFIDGNAVDVFVEVGGILITFYIFYFVIKGIFKKISISNDIYEFFLPIGSESNQDEKIESEVEEICKKT